MAEDAMVSKEVKDSTESAIQASHEQEVKDSKKSAVQVSHEQQTEVKYFQCCQCVLKEKYEYYGKSPPFMKNYKLLEDAYVIEDPFLPPKQGEYVVLGAHCVKCNRTVCKDSKCSFYFDGTYCISCAQQCCSSFPNQVQDKLKKFF